MTHARLVAIDAAWAARHIELHGIVGTLMPASRHRKTALAASPELIVEKVENVLNRK